MAFAHDEPTAAHNRPVATALSCLVSFRAAGQPIGHVAPLTGATSMDARQSVHADVAARCRPPAAAARLRRPGARVFVPNTAVRQPLHAQADRAPAPDRPTQPVTPIIDIMSLHVVKTLLRPPE